MNRRGHQSGTNGDAPQSKRRGIGGAPFDENAGVGHREGVALDQRVGADHANDRRIDAGVQRPCASGPHLAPDQQAGQPVGDVVGSERARQCERSGTEDIVRELAQSDPLVLILHVGYLWSPLGLALLGLSLMRVAPRSAAIHSLTAGAMATMILAVMTRASLGHTARELKAGPLTVALYALVTFGAVLRVAASLRFIDYNLGIDIAAIAWGGAFLLFLLGYAPVLWKPRLGEAR